MDHIIVMMSTYNGEKYICKQIESILQQKNVNITLLIRDDGSVDKTKDIIRGFQLTYNNIVLIEGQNVGWIKSFNILYREAFSKFPNAEYFSFSDQDDVWFDDKLISGINKLKEIDVPCLYHCNVISTDDELNPLFMFEEKRIKNKKTAFFVPSTLGCTIIYNRKLAKLLCFTNDNDMIPHDIWTSLVCRYTGKLIEDDKPYMYYRQHNNNASGGTKKRSLILLFKQQMKHFIKGQDDKKAIILYRTYKDYIDDKDLRYIYKLSQYKSSIIYKLYLLCDLDTRKHTIRGTLFLKLQILFSKY